MSSDDYLANFTPADHVRMALDDPRPLSDEELERRAFHSVGGQQHLNQIIANARWEISRRETQRETESLQRRTTEAAERSANRLAFITWVLVGIGVAQVMIPPGAVWQSLTHLMSGVPMKNVFDVLGLGIATLSAPFLWLGSEQIPVSIRTIGERGAPGTKEGAFIRRRTLLARIGFGLLFTGFFLQFLSRAIP